MGDKNFRKFKQLKNCCVNEIPKDEREGIILDFLKGEGGGQRSLDLHRGRGGDRGQIHQGP